VLIDQIKKINVSFTYKLFSYFSVIVKGKTIRYAHLRVSLPKKKKERKNNWTISLIIVFYVFSLQGSDAESILFESSTPPTLSRKCKYNFFKI